MQDAAANIARIDPAQCRLSPNRLPIAPEHCADLTNSIRAHGQLVPGLRRPNGTTEIRYNLYVCGRGCFFATITASAMSSRPHAQAA
jgi:ParB-like chromosome segregation protein Spo0J